MTLLLADTFTSSLARLTGDEQKAVKTTAFDLQMNPASPGMKFHKLERARDRNFWSVRVSSDIRLIVHKTDDRLLLCYVDHHDAAYAWAERRKIEVHPSTGAAQLVEIRETVREIEVPRYVDAPHPRQAPAPRPQLFDGKPDDELLSYGVPPEWLADVRQATEDTLLDLVGHLPGEAAEALLTVATGGMVTKEPALAVFSVMPGDRIDGASAFAHPEAQRRFRVMDSVEDLQRALDAPWEAWTVFLHPAQQAIVNRHFKGPARVAGSAGTGKTVVALHRAVQLARSNPQARVLVTTVSETLAGALRVMLDRLIGSNTQVRDRIDVREARRLAIDLHEELFGKVNDPGTLIEKLITRAAEDAKPHKFTTTFLATEWWTVVNQWQITSWEAYRDVARLGRKTRLSEPQRKVLWSVFEHVRAGLTERGLMTTADALARVTAHLKAGGPRPYDFVVADEAQDIDVAQLRFLAAIAGDHADGLFFAGDLGQRIYQAPFSWRLLGIDIRGRSQTLRVNYRTSHQIRRQADRLLGGEVSDVDGNTDVRRGTVSVFNGPEPTVQLFDTQAAESAGVAAWLRARVADGLAPHEIAVFVRSDEQFGRARWAVRDGGLKDTTLDEVSVGQSGHVAVGTMHFAKGLEFRAVVVMACDDEVVPLQSRIEGVVDEADLEDVYATERQLLYVACTRARDHLLVTGVRPGSEFLGDMSFQAASKRVWR